MKKNLIIAVYIIAVLGFSAMARASVTQLTTIHFDQDLLKLSIQGSVLDACQNNVTPTVLQTLSSNDSEVVVISVNAEKTQEECAFFPISESKFDIALDVRTLGLDSGKEYILKFSNEIVGTQQSLKVFIPEGSSDFVTYNIAKSGLIVAMGDGEFALVINDQDFYTLKSTIDLSQYVGNYVRVNGFELNYQVGPALELNTLDPLPRFGLKSDSTVFFVNSISSISQ